MLELIGAVVYGIKLVAPVIQNMGVIAEGARQVLELADNIFDRFGRNKSKPQQQAELRSAVVEIAAMPQAEFDRKAEEVVAAALADESPEYRRGVTEYVKQLPARARAVFARPEDPTGTTAPARWRVARPEDLVIFLPPRLPRFHEGDDPPLAPRWTLTKRLGIGGFGEVWKASHHEIPGLHSAFKFCLDPESLSLIFENELQNIALVRNELRDHPNIVKLQDAHLKGDAPWLQYEYVDGGELSGLVATWPDDLSARATRAVECVGKLADTLGYCHNRLSRRVIHRDLKPANILVGSNGTLKITDFGISDTQARKSLEEAQLIGASSASMSTPSLLRWAGTHTYASPQQRRGEDPHPSDDVHALGVMLYQMLVGNLTLELGVDMWSDLEEQRICQPLLDLLSRSVASRVERRYQDGSELAEALKSLPGTLVQPRVAVSIVDPEKTLYDEFDRRAADAREKEERAREQLSRREWGEAVATLESIFHPVLRNPDLYTRAVLHRDGKRWSDNPLNMEFALLPAGTFWMGGGDDKCGDKKVTIDYDFYLGVYPVTQQEWQALMGNNPSHFRKGGNGADKLKGVSDADLQRFPVECVSWNDCQNFLKTLNDKSKQTGWYYRLPREAEWEYGARAGATTQALCAFSYYFQEPTNTLSPQKANFDGSNIGRTCRVGSYEPNRAGLFDMHGQVWEWSEDAFDGSDRVIRGGSWGNSAGNASAGSRGRGTPDYSFNDRGLRLARVPIGK